MTEETKIVDNTRKGGEIALCAVESEESHLPLPSLGIARLS